MNYYLNGKTMEVTRRQTSPCAFYGLFGIKRLEAVSSNTSLI